MRRIIGANGARMKDIVAKSGGDAKLRLRGKGSGFVERDTKSESPEPLQLCISCPRMDGYSVSKRLSESLLIEVYAEYDKWCVDHGKSDRAPRIKMTERHHVGEAGSGGQTHAIRDTPHRGDGGPPAKRQRRRQGQSSPNQQADANVDRGDPPEGAPDPEEIEIEIEARNEARRGGDFGEADRIRDSLKAKGVVLSDEKGRHGSGLSVTSWRYWRA